VSTIICNKDTKATQNVKILVLSLPLGDLGGRTGFIYGLMESSLSTSY